MGTLIVLLVIAALAGGVFWNHKNKAAAFAGVEFHVPQPPQTVAAAIMNLYCRGAKAAVKSALARVSVTSVGDGGFNFGTKSGDEGQIEVHPYQGGSIVRARTSELFIGSTQTGTASGLMALSRALVHLVFLMLRVAPYAANMKRFQRGLEYKVTRQVNRQISSS